MMNYGEQLLAQKFPYSTKEIFNQICYYKIFEVNLKRAILMNDKSNIQKVRFINSEWFEKWKKLSYYEAIKDELNMNQTIQENYNNSIKNYLTIIQNSELMDKLDSNINNSILFNFLGNGKVEIDPYSNFEIISPELWDCFVPSNNINNGTSIELKVGYFTKDSLFINLTDNSCYLIFWKLHEQQLGKLILIFSDQGQKFQNLENIKKLGMNNFYACYLEDLTDEKDINMNGYSFKCINKSLKNKIINRGDNTINNNFIPVGLENIGATCYMNSALQCLVHIPKLSKYFLEEKNIIEKAQNNLLSSSFLKVVENLLRKTSDSLNINSYSPNEFFSIIQTNPIFQGIAGDSIDLIRFFIQTINKELNWKTEGDYFAKYFTYNNNDNNNNYEKNILNNFINSFTSRNNSIITQTFFFIEKSQLTCCNCNNTAISFGCQSELIFPLEEIRKFYNRNNSVSLQDGFNFYKNATCITGLNQISCSFCHCQSDAIQSNSLYSTPDVLIINLNRGKGNIFDVGIQFDEDLELYNEVEAKIGSNKFKLISFITHFGPSNTSGHFIAFCYVENNNKWYEFNDSIVNEISFEEAKNKGVIYVLFYQKQE